MTAISVEISINITPDEPTGAATNKESLSVRCATCKCTPAEGIGTCLDTGCKRLAARDTEAVQHGYL